MDKMQILYKYIEELKLSNKSASNPKFALRVLFDYLDENNLDFTKMRIQQAQDFQTYLVTKTDKKGKIYYSKRTVSTMIGSITAFYDWLSVKKYIYANPFLEIKKLRNPKMLPKNILDEAKTDKLFKRLKDFHRGKNLIERKALYKSHVIAEVMYSTGARISEIAQLKPDDIDFTRSVVRIKDSKSNQIRDVILNEYTGKVLKIFIDDMREYINFGKNNIDNSLLFGTGTNLQMWFNAVLNRTSKRLKLGKYSSHNIRHSVGAHLLKNGCDIRFIQEILGHKKLASTQIYTRIEKDDLKGVLDEYHPRRL